MWERSEVVVFIDLARVDAPLVVLAGDLLEVRAAGRWREFGEYVQINGDRRRGVQDISNLRELVADVVEIVN